jgi:hypothetical protein
MRTKWIFILVLCAVSLTGCPNPSEQRSAQPNSENKAPAQSNAGAAAVNQPEKTPEKPEEKGARATNDEPRTVRDFFNRLPQQYFTLEGCRRETDKNCERARAEYVKSYLEVEDTANGYWKSSCDGGQSCLRMALFKRPDAGYIVGVHTLHEADEINYFLEYRDGAWTDISAKVVPEFSNRNIYELPRYGTTVEVYEKVYPEPEFSERGKKIYELEWKNGKFARK